MRIKNINGTSDSPCPCGTWLKHWQKFSKQVTIYCPADGCLKKDLVGAHVRRAEGLDNTWYIYPLCSAHNMYSGELEVSDSYMLVAASKKETCER